MKYQIMRTERTNILVDKELKERIEANYPGLTWNERLAMLLEKEGELNKSSQANIPDLSGYTTREEHNELNEKYDKLKSKFSEVLHDLIKANNLKRTP